MAQIIDNAQKSALILRAEEALNLSYSPYSGIRVGAALLTQSGHVWSAGNIGNACSTLNCCAEQAAIIQAVVAKDTQFRAIAIVENSGRLCPPCGRCLQLLAEFSEEMAVLGKDQNGIREWKLQYLLPNPFRRPKEF